MIYIISHGRPNNQRTYNLLRSCGYTGKITIVVDDEDKTMIDYYKAVESDSNVEVGVFSKSAFIDCTDTGMITPMRNFAVFARNAVEQDAIDKKYKYFWVFDDDLTSIRMRYIDGNSLKSLAIKNNLDSVLKKIEDYAESVGIDTLSFGTANNYIGGKYTAFAESSKHRMCYNAFLRKTESPVEWSLNMCEDRITSLKYSTIGQIWMQLLCVQIDTMPLGGKVDGGNSDVYRTLSELTQVFFPIMTFPNCNKIRIFKGHYTNTYIEPYMCPKIISSTYRKEK
jgi:hypothetical protein